MIKIEHLNNSLFKFKFIIFTKKFSKTHVANISPMTINYMDFTPLLPTHNPHILMIVKLIMNYNIKNDLLKKNQLPKLIHSFMHSPLYS